uniref:C2H2-type domain-containing protein n=1 Tax=Strigamia maritima TaxID=126957 RepID=T1J2P2_STRMM
MNSTTTVTDANVLPMPHVGAVNSLVAVHVPSPNTACSPNSFFSDVLLLESSEIPGSPETFYIDGEPVSSPSATSIANDSSPLLVKDPNLYSASQEIQSKRKRSGPPPRKKKRMSPTYQRFRVNVDTSLCDSPPSPTHVNWPCAFCERFFTSKTTLYRHYRTIHPNRHCARCVNPNLELPMEENKSRMETEKNTKEAEKNTKEAENSTKEAKKSTKEAKMSTKEAKNSTQEAKKSIKEAKKVTKETRQTRNNKKKSREEIENELKVKFGIKECKVYVKNMTNDDIWIKTQLSPMLRSFDYPRMYSGSAKKVNFLAENEENMVGSDVLIGNDILTQEIVIEEMEPKVRKEIFSDRDASPKSLPSLGGTPQKESSIYDCKECGKVYELKMGLINHKRFKHSEISVPNLKCDKCSEDFGQLKCYQQHIQSCKGKESEEKSVFRGRNLFEELTNFRPMQIDRKTEINGFSKQDDKLSDIEEDDDDAIIMQAEHQLLNSPTSSHKSDLDERRNSVQRIEDKIINSLKRKFSDKLDEPKIETHQKLPAKRKLDNPTIGDRRSERRCSNGNTVCMSPYVVVNRLENVKSSLRSTIVVKKKRGRPRKHKGKVGSPQKQEKPRKYKVKVEPSATRLQSTEPTVKRKRGRPKKIRANICNEPCVKPCQEPCITACQEPCVEQPQNAELAITGTIRLIDDDDFSFSQTASENEDTIEVEGDFLNMENDEDGDLNLTLSDDDTLSLNVPGFLADNLESKLMNLSEEDIEIDVTNFIDDDDVASQVNVETASEQLSEQLHEPEKKSRNMSDCFSLVV